METKLNEHREKFIFCLVPFAAMLAMFLYCFSLAVASSLDSHDWQKNDSVYYFGRCADYYVQFNTRSVDECIFVLDNGVALSMKNTSHAGFDGEKFESIADKELCYIYAVSRDGDSYILGIRDGDMPLLDEAVLAKQLRSHGTGYWMVSLFIYFPLALGFGLYCGHHGLQWRKAKKELMGPK